jgi:hypothetical protein
MLAVPGDTLTAVNVFPGLLEIGAFDPHPVLTNPMSESERKRQKA